MWIKCLENCLLSFEKKYVEEEATAKNWPLDVLIAKNRQYTLIKLCHSKFIRFFWNLIDFETSVYTWIDRTSLIEYVCVYVRTENDDMFVLHIFN